MLSLSLPLPAGSVPSLALVLSEGWVASLGRVVSPVTRYDESVSLAESNPLTDPAQVLSERRDEIVALARRHSVVGLRVFGSVARGDQRPGSDLDLLVDFADGVSLFDQARFERELTALLGIDVDVISSRALLSRDDDILADAVVVEM